MDEDTLQKMIDRQYEILRRERMKGPDEQKSTSMETNPSDTSSAPSAINNDDSQSSAGQPEVCTCKKLRLSF